MKRSVLVVLIGALSILVVPDLGAQPKVGGQGPPATQESTSTTTSDPSGSTTSSIPGPGDSTTTTTVDPNVTTTTYLPPVPPELVEDPRLPYLVDPESGDGLEAPVAQPTFNPQSVQILPERVAESKLVLDQETAVLSLVSAAVESRTGAVAMLEARVGELASATKAAVRKAAVAREKLRDHAVIAYTTRRSDPKLSIIDMTNVADVGVAKEYMSVLMNRQDQLVRDYDKARKGLSAQNAALADDLGVERSKLTEDKAALEKAFAAVQRAQQQLAAYEAGAHAYVDGFVFPIAADAEFIDSWGYPRMTGTSYEHWHQGTDIFADYGAPVIASVDGVIERLGQATLGGNKLWIKGDSGTSFYYAHLSAFAPGVADGLRVKAGQLVGYVGDTGNAKGTSPHLHFEVHPDGADVVNGYPLLKAAYGNRPTFRAVAPPIMDPVLGAPATSVPEPPPVGG